jgi:hypothetical protein
VTVLDLEVSLACVACNASIPVNAYVGAVACHQCERRVALDATTWRLVLDEPLREAGALSPGVERTATLNTDAGVIRRVYRAGDPACVRCAGPVPSDRFFAAVAAPGSRAVCPRCQSPQPLRAAAAAPELGAAGVVAIACESEEQLAGTRPRREPVALACTSCGGGLSVDGSSRVVTCPFCKREQYLPNELLASLRSVPVRRWSLLLRAGAAAAQPKATRAKWGAVTDVLLDGRGSVFVSRMPESGQGAGILCMSLDMTLRWSREGLGFHSYDARLALTPTGHLLVWDDRGTACVLQPSDGATVFEFSGAQGAGMRLETRGAYGLAIAPDGTIVVLANGYLLRTDAYGNPISLWGSGSREPRAGGDSPSFLTLRNKPHRVDSFMKLGGGWDGGLHLTASVAYDDALQDATFSRDGRRVRVARCPIAFNPGILDDAAMTDARGATYFVVQERPGTGGEHSVHCAWPDGRAGEWLVPRSRGGLLGAEKVFSVGPDGTIVALGRESQMRVFGPDRRVLFLSHAAEQHDAGRAPGDELLG